MPKMKFSEPFPPLPISISNKFGCLPPNACVLLSIIVYFRDQVIYANPPHQYTIYPINLFSQTYLEISAQSAKRDKGNAPARKAEKAVELRVRF
jgi:hypothetical protein